MKPLRTIAVAVTGAVVLAGQAVAATPSPQHDSAAALTAPAHTATAKYNSHNQAKKPGMGAQGVHYVKGDLVNDPAIDAKHLEVLVYAPDRHGGLHLAALEYVVIKADWDAHASPAASGASAPTWSAG